MAAGSKPRTGSTSSGAVSGSSFRVGHILITTGGYQITAEGVFTYKANNRGQLVALRAYWEMDKAAASSRKV